jgi:cyclase
MLKKRLIFTLLYNDGQFMLSRNFRLQKVGDMRWLQENYNFDKVSFSIDELVVLDVTRGQRNAKRFNESLERIAKECFMPIAAGGGVSEITSARALLRAGADKVVVNSALSKNPDCISLLAREFGQQCVVASVDIKRGTDGQFLALIQNGAEAVALPAAAYLAYVEELPIGELYLNSIDRDGTGQGLDLALLDLLPVSMSQPVILAGGIGNASHMSEGLSDRRVDAVATAHLFNFVGDGLNRARQRLIQDGYRLASWDLSVLSILKAA